MYIILYYKLHYITLYYIILYYYILYKYILFKYIYMYIYSLVDLVPKFSSKTNRALRHGQFTAPSCSCEDATVAQSPGDIASQVTE
jgi:hypothetical protein